MNFVLIGGCNFSNKENKKIHSKIIELSKKAKPRLLYIHVSSKKIDESGQSISTNNMKNNKKAIFEWVYTLSIHKG